MIPLPESVVSQSSIASSWMTTDPKASINTIPELGAPAAFCAKSYTVQGLALFV